MRNSIKIISVLVLSVFLATNSFGFGSVQIRPEESSIKIAIKYTVIGKYRAEFDDYSGEIVVDHKNREILSVNLRINPSSIESDCNWCDKVVRSDQVLDVEKFPDIIFSGNQVIKNDSGFIVTGTLDLHGEVREISFPFSVEGLHDDKTHTSKVSAEGRWIIPRKDYNIIWNRLLDKGGVIVGNDIIVDWKVNTTVTDEEKL